MTRKRTAKINKILAEAKALLSAQFADQLKGIILFGSYARGDFTEGSDIDLLALLSPLVDRRAERQRIFPAVCDLSLEHDVVLSIILMDYDVFRSQETPLALNAGREGEWL